jgi:hypothetical protein
VVVSVGGVVVSAAVLSRGAVVDVSLASRGVLGVLVLLGELVAGSARLWMGIGVGAEISMATAGVVIAGCMEARKDWVDDCCFGCSTLAVEQEKGYRCKCCCCNKSGVNVGDDVDAVGERYLEW